MSDLKVTLLVRGGEDSERARTVATQRLNEWFAEAPTAPPFPPGTLLFFAMHDAEDPNKTDVGPCIQEEVACVHTLTLAEFQNDVSQISSNANRILYTLAELEITLCEIRDLSHDDSVLKAIGMADYALHKADELDKLRASDAD